VSEAVLGIVANPMSGRDIRRLVAKASVFPTAEKANMVQRMLTAAGAVGVSRVLLSTDVGGISAAVLRAVTAHRQAHDRHAQTGRAARRPGRTSDHQPWPDVSFVGPRLHTQSAADTTATVRMMIDAGARVIVCLGGDGTARVTAAACGEVPMLPLSTGTNNAFPLMREATVAGLAAGLVATGAVDPVTGTRRATTLLVEVAGRVENALVDVCIAHGADVGARALWDPSALAELYCTFAEPDGIGLSSVPGLLCPSPRSDPSGVALSLCPPAEARYVVHAPIAPGLVVPVGVRSWRRLEVGSQVEVSCTRGLVAVDGEREIAFTGRPHGEQPRIRLSADGPRCVDIPAVLAQAARTGLLRRDASPAPSDELTPTPARRTP
jgi:predicted polyphosphate/ATP-dependent NAD kinase